MELRGSWPLLRPGAVLVDTPGLASVHDHNTEAARAALLDADGAVIVLSADAPLSARERELLQVLRDRRSPTFFVLNKSDHLRDDELAEVRQFVVEKIGAMLRTPVTVFAVDARSALSCDPSHAKSGLEFDDLSAGRRGVCPPRRVRPADTPAPCVRVDGSGRTRPAGPTDRRATPPRRVDRGGGVRAVPR